jgi:hypothetical protein
MTTTSALTASRRELGARIAVEPGVGDSSAHSFTLRSLSPSRAEIPGRFSSSLLPPSFVRGRSATIFSTPHGALRAVGA